MPGRSERKYASCFSIRICFVFCPPSLVLVSIPPPVGTRVRLFGLLRDASVGLVIEGDSHWVPAWTLWGFILEILQLLRRCFRVLVDGHPRYHLREWYYQSRRWWSIEADLFLDRLERVVADAHCG